GEKRGEHAFGRLPRRAGPDLRILHGLNGVDIHRARLISTRWRRRGGLQIERGLVELAYAAQQLIVHAAHDLVLIVGVGLGVRATSGREHEQIDRNVATRLHVAIFWRAGVRADAGGKPETPPSARYATFAPSATVTLASKNWDSR